MSEIISPVILSQFGKGGNPVSQKEVEGVVVYTRVSTKEQSDKNLSLDTQRRALDEYALRHNLTVMEYFGGTYESAKTDGRKEFSRMIAYIKKNKRFVSKLLVYSIDRFSRSGGAAIKLAAELREKYGVEIFAITQPTDTSNPNGVFQQNIQLLFSEYDNQVRRQKVVSGMVAQLERGIWCLKPPMGYDIVTKNGNRQIVVNKVGKLLRQAFQWKITGLSNGQIVSKLRSNGVKIYLQKLAYTFANPFYCGILSHALLEGRLVPGQHEPLITQHEFLIVNELAKAAPKYGVKHAPTAEETPLKGFVKCSECSRPFAGYIVKKKGLYYYKCQTKGCRCNVSAIYMHEQFTDVLRLFHVNPAYKDELLFDLLGHFEQLVSADEEESKCDKSQLTELEKKIKILNEKHFITGEISKEVYTTLSQDYTEQRTKLAQKIEAGSLSLSNLKEGLVKALSLCENLNEIWASANFHTKQQFQNLLFPAGLVYDRKIKGYRTNEINPIFAEIGRKIEDLTDNKKGLTSFFSDQSNSVVSTGIEPVSKV